MPNLPLEFSNLKKITIKKETNIGNIYFSSLYPINPFFNSSAKNICKISSVEEFFKSEKSLTKKLMG